MDRWNFRIVKYGTESYGLCEVVYDSKGKVKCIQPPIIEGKSAGEIAMDVRHMTEDIFTNNILNVTEERVAPEPPPQPEPKQMPLPRFIMPDVEPINNMSILREASAS